MNKLPELGALVLACTALLTPSAAAQWKDWDYDLDQEKKPWSEMQTQLPPYPKPENLLKFDTGSNIGHDFFLDTASLSVGADKAVRYTLVVKTSGGATNVSFEGVRCEDRQYRVYAFGHANAQWSRARNAGWREIVVREVNGHHNVLYRKYLCSQTRIREAQSVKEIVASIKRGGQLAPGE